MSWSEACNLNCGYVRPAEPEKGLVEIDRGVEERWDWSEPDKEEMIQYHWVLYRGEWEEEEYFEDEDGELQTKIRTCPFFEVWFDGEREYTCETIEDARQCIREHEQLTPSDDFFGCCG